MRGEALKELVFGDAPKWLDLRPVRFNTKYYHGSSFVLVNPFMLAIPESFAVLNV